MAQIDVITWLWGRKYSHVDVRRLANQLKKYLQVDYKFHVFADLPYIFAPEITTHIIEDLNLVGQSCYCRLRMFDPDWQRRHKFDRMIISLDLDLVITGRLDSIFDGKADFKILQGVNSMNPNPFNASIMQLKVGCHSNVWSDFSAIKASKVPYYKFPDDQGWIWHMLPKADGWRPGPQTGIYAFKKPGWPGGSDLPADARIVAFIGYRKPEQFGHLQWIRKYWSAAA